AFALEIAQKGAELAAARWERTSRRLEAGEAGLSEWREHERLMRTAQERAVSAQRALHDALWELAEAVGGERGSEEGILARLPLAADAGPDGFLDDANWARLVAAVSARLDEAPFDELLQAYDDELMRARSTLRERQYAYATTAHGKLPRLTSEAVVQSTLGDGAGATWSVGLGVVALGGGARPRRERAALDLAEAERAVASRTRRVAWEGERALERIDEADRAVAAAETALTRVQEAVAVVKLRLEQGFATELELR